MWLAVIFLKFLFTETEYTAPPICGIGKNSETETTPAGELKLVLNSDKNVHEHEKGFTLHMIAAKGNGNKTSFFFKQVSILP